MVTIEQTIEIPADRCLRLELKLPETVPSGKTSVVLVFPASKESGTLPGKSYPVTFPTLEELQADAAEKAAQRLASGNDIFDDLRRGPPLFDGIDGVKYQRQLRDEWSEY